jgi:hypothetical protein
VTYSIVKFQVVDERAPNTYWKVEAVGKKMKKPVE